MLQIFVVENHADTLTWFSLYLEQLGHAVEGARSLQEGLEKLSARTPDVLFSDIGLPDGDGWELLRKAHLPDSVYCIAMSGFGMNSDRLRSKEAGFRHHLLKPLDPDEVENLLEEAAGEKAARQGRVSEAA